MLPRAGAFLSVVALLVFRPLCNAAPPAGYYASAENRTGSELRRALHDIIRGHVIIPDASSSFDTSDALRILDEDPSNTS